MAGDSFPSFSNDTLTLIQTKVHRPRLGQELISRAHLIRRLNQGVDRKLSLISAQVDPVAIGPAQHSTCIMHNGATLIVI